MTTVGERGRAKLNIWRNRHNRYALRRAAFVAPYRSPRPLVDDQSHGLEAAFNAGPAGSPAGAAKIRNLGLTTLVQEREMSGLCRLTSVQPWIEAVYRSLQGLAISLIVTDVPLAEQPVRLDANTLTQKAESEVDTRSEHKSGDSFLASLRERQGGVLISPEYYGEVFTNARGGRSTKQATRYLGLLNLPIRLELERIGLPIPGRFLLLGQNTHGQGLTDEFVGDTLVVSNIDSFTNMTRVSEYWWEGGILDDSVVFRLGKQDVNTEFLLMETAAGFVQSAFGLSPSTAFPTYPNQSMAAVALVELSAHWEARAGVWDAFSSGGNWGFSGNDSVFVVGELEYAYSLSELAGKLTVAGTYESAGELSDVPISAVHEFAMQLEQVLYHEDETNLADPQGLAIFAGYYPRFPGELVSDESIGDSLVTGLVYTGIIPRRNDDLMGAGVAWAALYQGGTGQETVFEWYYQAVVTPRTTIQPDLQYVVSPSGIYPDALVVGLRLVQTW